MALFDKFPIMNLLVEEIFVNLDMESLTSCQLVNKSWNAYLANPRFWFRKTLREEVQKYKSSIVQDKLYLLANLHWLEVINANSENDLDLKLRMIKCLKNRISHTYRQKVPKYENTSPLFLASEFGDLDLVKHVLKSTNPNDVLDIENSLRHNTNIDSVSIQIDDVKANPKVVPIHIAAKNGHLEVMKFLIKTFEVKKPNHFVDNNDKTAMNYAAQNGHSNIIKHLLKYPRTLDFTSVEIALQNGNYRSAFLLDRRTSIRYFSNHINTMALVAFVLLSIATLCDCFGVFYSFSGSLTFPLMYSCFATFIVLILSAIPNC